MAMGAEYHGLLAGWRFHESVELLRMVTWRLTSAVDENCCYRSIDQQQRELQ
jgi:hypothetical protein